MHLLKRVGNLCEYPTLQIVPKALLDLHFRVFAKLVKIFQKSKWGVGRGFGILAFDFWLVI